MLVALAVAGAGDAAAPKLPKDAPTCARPGVRPIFVSPAGEPFRGEAGQPYPAGQWFAGADRDHNGALTRDEVVADAMRFFATLDRDHDRRLTPDEIAVYERDVAPETSLYGNPDDRNDRSRGVGRSADYGGPMGAGRYAWFNVPEPVVAADQDIDRIVTADEFATTAASAYTRLDPLQRGSVRLQDLPRTPQQIAIEGPCRPPKKRRGEAE